MPGQELAHHGADHRRAAHAAADLHLEAELAGRIAQQLQADVVPAVAARSSCAPLTAILNLRGRNGELRVQRAPLAQDFAERPRVGDLVGGDAGERVGW